MGYKEFAHILVVVLTYLSLNVIMDNSHRYYGDYNDLFDTTMDNE